MGRYCVVRKLAAGGMAEVLLAKVIGAGGFEKPVAVKRMLPSVAADPSFVEAFLREARLTVALQHPNIVQVHDFGAVKEQYYQVLEYVDGENLRQVLTALTARGRQLSVGEAAYVVEQVAEGLAYAHGVCGSDQRPLNIIHRDINPSNVMISRIGEVKLADFGIAKATDGAKATQVGVIKGKAGYLSPEQVRGTEVDQRSDLFLMGLLLHELLSGKRLFEAPNYFHALQRIAAFQPKLLEPLPQVPSALWSILLKLLEPDPAQRTASARALADDLQAFLFDSRLRVGARDMAAVFARAFPDRISPADALKAAPANEKSEVIQIDEADVVEERPGTGPTPVAPPPMPPRASPASAARLEPADAPAQRPAPIPAAHAARPLAGARTRRKLGEILLAHGRISTAQLEQALRRKEGRLGERLTAAGLVNELDVVRALAEQNGISYVSDDKLRALPVPEEAVKLLTPELAAKLGAVPVQLRGRVLFCAMQEPLDSDALQSIKFATGAIEVKGLYATEGAIRAARERFYGKEDRGDASDWRGRVQTFSPSGLTPFADRVTGTREKYFDEAELERRMAAEAGPGPQNLPAHSAADDGPLARAQNTPLLGLVPPVESSPSVRLAVSAALGSVRKVLLVTDVPDQLEAARQLLGSAPAQLVSTSSAAAEHALDGERPDLIVVAEDGVPHGAALAKQLASKAQGVEVRLTTLACSALGEAPAMARVIALYAIALDALSAPATPPPPPDASQVPAAARLARQLAAWLGGGRAEQERAGALLHLVAAANRIRGRSAFESIDPAGLDRLTGGERAETAELLALAAAPPTARARPSPLAVAATLAFAQRAGAVQVERDHATRAIQRVAAETSLPAQALEALRALAYQGGSAGLESVVVVDSDAVSAGLLQQRLVGAGLHAILARTGAEARELMKRGARALVASTSLPDTDGLALVATLRADCSEMPQVIYLLAQDAGEDVALGLDAGADDVMIKPVSPEVIAAKLRRAMGGRSRP